MEGRRIIKRILIGIGIAIVLGYSYFVLDDFIRGPRIIIETPKESFATTTPSIAIGGRVIHINNLTLNGSPISFSLEGNFRETILLATGYNVITLSATDRYNRVVEKKIEMTLLPSKDTFLMSEPTGATSTVSNF